MINSVKIDNVPFAILAFALAFCANISMQINMQIAFHSQHLQHSALLKLGFPPPKAFPSQLPKPFQFVKPSQVKSELIKSSGLYFMVRDTHTSVVSAFADESRWTRTAETHGHEVTVVVYGRSQRQHTRESCSNPHGSCTP